VTDKPSEGVEGVWAKLRHRKVVQWGIAYAASAWVLLQGVAYVTDTFHWPDQIQQLATLALLIGLPGRHRHVRRAHRSISGRIKNPF
jgi:hypothetical protein